MDGHALRRIILFLTAVAVGLAVISFVTVSTRKSETIREEYIPTPPTVQHTLSELVEKPVEAVKDSTPVEEKEVVPMYHDKRHEILSIIIYQESGGDTCSDDTRRKVGSVFLNRVASPLFPNTFEEVATQYNQYGTLYITGIKWPERAKLEAEAHAVQRAKDIAEELILGGSILPSHVIWQAEFRQGDGVYCYQDGIYFCYSEVSK